MTTLQNAERTGDWLQTYMGKKFWPLDPRPEDINILDVAHSLSLQCRYNGHVNVFYSVAEHSVRVSHAVPEEHALWGLMHDAAEAYVGDIVRPVKVSLSKYDAIENNILAVVAQVFDLPWPIPEEVWVADDIVLVTEKRDLMSQSPDEWKVNQEPLDAKIEPWKSSVAEARFLMRFEKLCPSRAIWDGRLAQSKESRPSKTIWDGRFAQSLDFIRKMNLRDLSQEDVAAIEFITESLEGYVQFAVDEGAVSVRRLADIMDCYVEDITTGV